MLGCCGGGRWRGGGGWERAGKGLLVKDIYSSNSPGVQDGCEGWETSGWLLRDGFGVCVFHCSMGVGGGGVRWRDLNRTC